MFVQVNLLKFEHVDMYTEVFHKEWLNTPLLTALTSYMFRFVVTLMAFGGVSK